MNGVLSTIMQYSGTGFLTVLYVIALFVLFLREDDKANRIIFLYMPLCFIVLFLLPPVRNLYARVEGTDTYYRFLWLIPMSVTTCYCLIRQTSRNLITGVVTMAVVIILCGQYTYSNENIVKAENRLHLPQAVLDVTDYILNDTGGKRTMAAMPPSLVQFVRQYDTRIMMPYGREMLMPQYANYYQSVYDAMTANVIDGDQLVEAVREYNCNYLVMEASRMAGVDLGNSGLEYLTTVDGYNIYKDPTQSEDLGG